MKILFITTKCPLPTNDGHSLRSFNLLRQVAAVHEVCLLSFVKYPQEYDSIPELEKLCSSVSLFDVSENNSRLALIRTLVQSLFVGKPFVACKYDTHAMREAIRDHLAGASFDLVHFDMLPLVVYRDEVQGKKTLLNEHNVESMLLGRRVEAATKQLDKWFYRKQQNLLEQFERAACQNVDYVVCCSDEDREILRNFAPSTPVEVVPNGVDTEFFAPDFSISEEPGNMIFVGGLNWFPNLEGLQWFDKNILPMILQQHPEAHLHVIGQKARNLTWHNTNAITCHGFVEDIRPFIARAEVFIVPLSIGGGTRLKILNAMSMGKAVVSTPVGAEGLGVKSGKNVVLADQEQAFAEGVNFLFEHPEYRKKIATNGRNFIKEQYEWQRIGEKLLDVYQKIRSREGKNFSG